MSFRFIFVIKTVLLLLAVCGSDASTVDVNCGELYDVKCQKKNTQYERTIELRGIMQEGDGSNNGGDLVAQSVDDDAKAATEAVNNAETKIKNAKSAINTILQAAKTAKAAAEKAEKDDLPNADSVKNDAEEKGKGITDAAQYVNDAKSAYEEAKKHLQTAKENGTKAVEAAENAETAAQQAEKDLDEAKSQSDHSQKKTKAEQAGTAAEPAQKEAEKATPLTAASTNALNQFKESLKKARVAMHQVKTIAAAKKTKAAHESCQGYTTQVDMEKEKVTNYQKEVNEWLVGTSDELKAQVKTQTDIIDNSLDTATKNAQAIKEAEKKFEGYQSEINAAVEAVKRENTEEKAKEECVKAEGVVDTAEKEAQDANRKLTEIESAVKNAEKAKDIIIATVAADKVKIYYGNAKKLHSEAEIKNKTTDDIVKELEKKHKTLEESVKKDVNAQLETLKNTQDKILKQVEKIKTALSSMEEKTKEADATAVEVNKENAVLDAIKTQSEKSTQAKKSAELSFNNTRDASQVIITEFEKIEKTKYVVVSIVALHKTKKAHHAANEYFQEALKKNTSSHSIVVEIENILTQAADDSKESIEKYLKFSKSEMAKMKVEITNIGTAQKSAKERESQAISAHQSVIEPTTNLEKIKDDSNKAVTAATDAENEPINSQKALQNVNNAAESIEKTKYRAITLVSVNKVMSALGKTDSYKTQCIEKKKEISAVLTDIESVLNDAPKSAQEGVKEQQIIAQNAEKGATEKENEANNAFTKTEERKREAQNALQDLDANENKEDIIQRSEKALNAASGATTEEKKAKDALTKILKVLEDAVKAKHASRALVASAKTTEFITTMESYKEEMLGKQKRATQVISAMKSAHDDAPNDVKESVAPKITDAQNALQSITEAMKTIHTAQEEVRKQKTQIDRAMTDTAVSDVSDAASKAQEAEKAANAAAEQIVKAHEAHQRALEATQLVESIQTDVSNMTNTTKEKVNVPLSGKDTREHTTENAVEEKDNSLHENTNHNSESSKRDESEETISTDYTNTNSKIGGQDQVGKSITAKLSDSSSSRCFYLITIQTLLLVSAIILL